MSTSHDLHESPSTRRREGSSRSQGGGSWRRHVTPKGWAVGAPYSAATARTRLRNGEVPQLLCAALSSRPRSHVPTHCSCSHAGSPAPPWVAGSPVAFLVATLRWPPAAALPVWTFCSAQYLGETATLVPSRWSFARRLMLDTVELMWTSVKRVGTRRINPSLVP